jgi:hypothetical protein
MKPTHLLATLVLAALSLAPLSPAWAGDDHAETPVAAAGSALPRFAAESELFELVGVVNGKQITLYLDHFADGSPVKDAKLELELGGEKVQVRVPVEPHAEGEFEATLAQELKPGVIAVAATVMASEESDLLVGELDLHDPEDGADAADSPHRDSTDYLLWSVAGFAGLALLLAIVRRLRATRSNKTGVVA